MTKTGAGSAGTTRDAGASTVSARLRRRGVGALVLCASAAVVAALAVLPARTWMSQREQRTEVQADLVATEAEVAQLQAQLDLLETDAEIERRAREDFDLVLPGEESFRILAPAGG